jgi:microcystin degradation protein MlrC
MKKIALVGFLHEAHSFATQLTSLDRFREHHFAFGREEMRKAAGVSTETAGVFDTAEKLGFELKPLFYAFPLPGGIITADAFEFFRQKLVEGLKANAPLDGVILNLHGAMVAQNAPDAEGEFARIARATVGPNVPIVSTLDCHGNVSELMVRSTNALIPYDTNPHTDCYHRGVQAAQLMKDMLDGKVKPVTALVKPPLIPIPQKQNSAQSPWRDIWSLAFELEKRPGVINVGVLPGFSYSDVPEVGVSILAITNNDPKLAREIGEAVARKAWELREQFVPRFPKPAEAVQMAIHESKWPVILVDTGDNVGGGSAADGTVLLYQLLRQNARDAVMIIRDAEVVEKCFAAGVNGTVSASVGAKTDKLHGEPVYVTGRVKLLSDGRYINRGPMHGMAEGVEWQMGRCAVLECRGVTLLLTENRVMPMNIYQLRSQGIQPEYCKIIVVKAAVAFRASYEPVAAKIIEVDTPGLTAVDLAKFPFRNLKRRLFPLHVDATWEGTEVFVEPGA